MKKKLRTQLFVAVTLTCFGIIMVIAGFICPPLAVIHSSVLTAYGETLTFAGSLIGLDYHYRFKQKDEAPQAPEWDEAPQAPPKGGCPNMM